MPAQPPKRERNLPDRLSTVCLSTRQAHRRAGSQTNSDITACTVQQQYIDDRATVRLARPQSHSKQRPQRVQRLTGMYSDVKKTWLHSYIYSRTKKAVTRAAKSTKTNLTPPITPPPPWSSERVVVRWRTSETVRCTIQNTATAFI